MPPGSSSRSYSWKLAGILSSCVDSSASASTLRRVEASQGLKQSGAGCALIALFSEGTLSLHFQLVLDRLLKGDGELVRFASSSLLMSSSSWTARV